MTIHFIAKLRWVQKRPNEQMIIRNFEAHHEQIQYMLELKAKPSPGAPSVCPAAKELLDNETKDYLSGQHLTIPMATAADCFGYSDIGGIM